jgi:EAL domain-containing protein (putative c-di-GMP-specific phosphodiesterase class I)
VWPLFPFTTRFRSDLVKIDRTRVSVLGNDPAAVSTVRAAVAMAEALGLGTGAEGVTRIGQLEMLLELGCDVAQGPLFSRPETAEEIQRLLAAEHVWLAKDLRSVGVAEEVAG